MFRTTSKNKDRKQSLPRPVLALFVKVSKARPFKRQLPIGDFLRDEFELFMPSLAFSDPRKRLALSVHDNSGDKWNKVVLLPPLEDSAYILIPFPEKRKWFTVRYSSEVFAQESSAAQVRDGENNSRLCTDSNDYSYERVRSCSL